MTSIKALSSGSCCSQLFYRITALNNLKKIFKKICGQSVFYLEGYSEISRYNFLKIFVENFVKLPFLKQADTCSLFTFEGHIFNMFSVFCFLFLPSLSLIIPIMFDLL